MELTLDEALKKGIEAHKAGKAQEADRYYTAILKADPKHPDANHNMGVLAVGVGKVEEALPFFKTGLEVNPNVVQYWISYIDALISLNRIEDAEGELKKAKQKEIAECDLAVFEEIFTDIQDIADCFLEDKGLLQGELRPLLFLFRTRSFNDLIIKAKELLLKYPSSVTILNIIGKALVRQANYTSAIEYFEKVVKVQPDLVSCHKDLGDLYKKIGNFKKSLVSYKRVLHLNPKNPEVFNSIGNIFMDMGEILEAMSCYNNALELDPLHIKSFHSLSFLTTQTRLCSENKHIFLALAKLSTKDTLAKNPKTIIQKVIYYFLSNEIPKAKTNIKRFDNCKKKALDSLGDKDKVSVLAYHGFISRLINASEIKVCSSPNKVFHIGDSHCLSLAHQPVILCKKVYRVEPLLTIGAKAYHLSQKANNKYKAITSLNLSSIPHKSKVFLCFGEIDCRSNEGFISAAAKQKKSVEDIISNTVAGYLNWFFEQNQSKNHSLLFFNVPAPIYQKKLSNELNNKVIKTIKLFNDALAKHILDYDFNIIDVNKFTVGRDEFSNGIFNIDKYHLSSDAIPEIEKQIDD